DDELAAGAPDVVDLRGDEHGARADQTRGGQGRAEQGDAREGVGRAERDLDDAEAGGEQRGTDLGDLARGDAAEDGDQAGPAQEIDQHVWLRGTRPAEHATRQRPRSVAPEAIAARACPKAASARW